MKGVKYALNNIMIKSNSLNQNKYYLIQIINSLKLIQLTNQNKIIYKIMIFKIKKSKK